MIERIFDKNHFPIGHICKCGFTHKWAGYVFAHFTEKLTHKCHKCAIEVIIFNGHVVES